ncbi:uncharacterized protein LOC122870992 isoform X2 [Siniperca chuatsi]|uniref:uncharacterized protein LOC122870992 isoform X2 n=1 Tax=Siniperca chuatsi TaxID=119488 RepID=UPI001CE0C60C|nr:uncharacterized protein LOC122870992 isoform X2 [Siniperca chuatsi]
MDDLKHPGPFNRKITLSCKTLDFYLKVLLLLENVKHNQSLMQHCPITTEVGGFPNFTSEAGSPFFFKLPIPATPGHTKRYQLSLADGDSTLPHWMVFWRQTSCLAGLALTEDCGIYHFKVSVIGEQRAAYFYLHILNRTVADKNPARNTLSCSQGEMTIWANLLLQLNPVTLDASQRIRLATIMADYLRLPLGFVYLFSRRKSFIQQQEKFRVCRQGGLAEKITRGNEKQDVSADVAQLLWRVGCQGEERQSDLAKVLEYSVTAGGLARLLEAPVFGWRVLCAPGGVPRKVKRDLQRLKCTPIRNMIVPTPTQVHQTAKLEHSHIYSLPLTKLEPSLSIILLHMNHVGTRLEPTHADDSTENTAISVTKGFLLQHSGPQADICLDSPEKVFKFTSALHACKTLMYHSDINPEMPIAILETNHMQKKQVSSNFLFSIKQTTWHPYSKDVNAFLERQAFTGNIILTTLHMSTSVEPGCTLPNRISVHKSQEHIKQTELSASKIKPHVEATGCSEQVSEVTSDPSLPSSTLHSIYLSLPLTPASYGVTSTLTHEAVDRKLLTTRLTLRPHPKESPLWSGSHRASHTDSESQPTVSSLGHIIYNQGPIKDHHTAKPTLYNLPSVSHPPLTETFSEVLLLNSRLKTIQSQPPSNRIPSTQLFPDVSPTSYLMAEQLSITQHFDTTQHLSSALSAMNQDVMSQLNVTTQDVSSVTLTGQLTLSGQTELESSLSTSLLEPSVMTFTPALPSELGFFSGQLETPHITNPVFTVESLKASSFTMPLSQTFSKSLLPDISVSSLQRNLENKVEIYLQSKIGTELCFDQNALIQTLSSDILLKSLQPTYPSWVLQVNIALTKTHHILSVPLFVFSHISLVIGMTTSVHLNTAILTTIAPSPSVTCPVPLSVFESARLVSNVYFDPTAPSAVQEPYTTSFIHQMQTLDPSFPLCGQSVAQDHVYVNGCTPQIRRTDLENTVEHVLDFLTGYSPDGKHWTVFPSQFLMSDSSEQFFSTQTSNPAMHLSASSMNLPPKVLMSIPVLMATVGFPFHFSIPPKTFLDPEDGEADALSLDIRLIDGPPISVGTWLALDGLELHGVPLEVDLQFAPQYLLLAARDRQSLSTWLPVTLDLSRSPVDPCHIFTLTAQRSLHSILRHRHRVELLLTKLSRFFNSSSKHNLSVVSIRPGSTVVSWYNYSLCGMGHDRLRRCHVDQIRSMWFAMRSADGSVNPAFREAMLPEFLITKVGTVSFRQDCFSTTSTPMFDGFTPAVHTTLTPGLGTNTSLSPTSNTYVSASPAITATSQQINYYQWMTGMFTALLVVCLLILIVLLVATVLHFCKGHRRSRTLAIWPASRMLSVRSRDLRAIRPRRPPLFQSELPPPPLRLWINLSQGNEGQLPSTCEQGRKALHMAPQPRPPQ